ncbi:aromatic acid exporter family protein [Paenibacillus sediminis]|uniref:Uncharacterized membrane protein YgaE (UPF0421/DUF939 family) n=1 Tax=Paenibacillus sediminis TaxID=664909 RepID=A0ABS4H023_9BACL|nr:aromatic acid exporter family protein [Paenibacillus sediminis]MBP1935873.1 uncharacterized membrane protein YgaE (UPF0421/DUF939 family) [Paenibacillus sediminis]
MGFRVIKTAIATLLAVMIAGAFGFKGATSAGILAILGVDVTRKRSLRTVTARFFASLLGLFFAFMLFAIFGFHFWVLALYILAAFPVITKAGFKEGIVTSSVVVFHVFTRAELSVQSLLTEIWLLIIGLGCAMIVNLIYMPKAESELMKIRTQVDDIYSIIFKQIAVTLRNPEYVWDGHEIIEAGEIIQQGLTMAKKALENQLVSPNEKWNIYFYMRRQQLDSIQNMMQLISQVYQKTPQCEFVSELFEQLSIDVKNPAYTGTTEKLLIKLEQDFKLMDLPATREEFEIRSALLQLCRELSHYLKIAKKDKTDVML